MVTRPYRISTEKPQPLDTKDAGGGVVALAGSLLVAAAATPAETLHILLGASAQGPLCHHGGFTSLTLEK